ncbi:hypothetical protein SLEP1_g19930 [Rubroshorea leprosula]|uniref:Association with the SNF1 complex (ASC) domain-containing protein n=1 Tax=Rubroshorea leprosula TaxID=152421 RepID=A0AAV5J0Y9_9ROSI|nr:hypothetical protein SLEP1_g19930 [Rubroshorea leprosula]
MGNANGREEGANGSEDPLGRSNGESCGNYGSNSQAPGRVPSSDSMANSPPTSPRRSRSPLLFAPQVPVAPLHRGDGGSPFYNQAWQHESHGAVATPLEQGIPVIITWNYGGNDVAVEGSWDNWTSRKTLQRSGKDHSILLVLPSGLYHYKFIVDGEWKYNPDLPSVADESGNVCNLLDVHYEKLVRLLRRGPKSLELKSPCLVPQVQTLDGGGWFWQKEDYVPEILDSVAEFEVPSSPESTYSWALPTEEDYAKEPHMVPPQLHLTVLDMDNQDEASPSKPQHIVLNHLFIEKGWATQSVVSLGLTHRFQSKYVTVVLYKPLKR